MAINTIGLAQKMTSALDKAVVQKAVTGFLADNAMGAKFVGAKTVLIPEINMNGLGDYDRDTGYVQGALTVSSTAYTLNIDRSRKFQLDAQDADESGVANLAGQVMGEFIRTKVVPEIDAYNLSKLAKYAKDNNQTVSGTLASEPYKIFTNAVLQAQDALSYDEELVAFVNTEFWAALNNSNEFTRQITVSNFRQGDVNLQVKSINGISLIPVVSDRMKTAITLLDGESTGQTAGGFTPALNAENVGLLVLPRKAAMFVKKTEPTRIFPPSQNQNADSWVFTYRIYYDLLIRNTFKEGIYAYTYSTGSTSGT